VLDRKKWFVMDVQQHHVDLDLYGGSDFLCFLDFIKAPGTVCPDSIGQLEYIRQVFVNSETNVGVISGLPDGIPCGPAKMAETRDLINELAGSERALSQAVCDPKLPNGEATAIDQMEHQVRDLMAARSSATRTATAAGGSTTTTARGCSKRPRASASRS
jgi:hypothetical protein